MRYPNDMLTVVSDMVWNYRSSYDMPNHVKLALKNQV